MIKEGSDMKTRYVILLAFLNFIFSSTIFQLLRINGTLFNTCIIISVILAALSTKENAIVFALISGALQDVFLGRILGVNFILYGLIVYVTIRLVEVMFKGNFITPLFLVVLGTFIYHFGFYIMMFFLQSTIPLALLYSKIMTEVLINSIIGFIIYAHTFKKVHGYKLGDFNA
jgi:rod shape-determining protein MreD